VTFLEDELAAVIAQAVSHESSMFEAAKNERKGYVLPEWYQPAVDVLEAYMSAREKLQEKFTFDELNNALRYENGFVYWKIKPHVKISVGDRAGSLSKHDGYRSIGYLGRSVQEHRVVWLLVTGAWPKVHLDHINGNRADNRFENLRECSRKQNSANRKMTPGRKLPKGVFLTKEGYYMASIAKDYIGIFKCPKEAGLAYDKAAVARFGEFAKLNFPNEIAKGDL